MGVAFFATPCWFCIMSELYNRIYEAVKKIPVGKVTTYAGVGAMVGNPKLARVVGNALHNNPYPGVVPCHRVVNSRGELPANFVFGGAKAQQKMLEAEGIEFAKDGKVDLKKYIFCDL